MTCQRPYRILSFDGGGLLALSYLPVLEGLETYLNAQIVESHQFDLVIGTSTGSIVAAGIKLGIPATELTDLYMTRAEKIFAKTPIWNRPFFTYPTHGLKQSLEERFRRKLGECATWADFALVNPELAAMVVLWNISEGRPSFLSTDLEQKPPSDSILRHARLCDVIAACCAAPTYFCPQGFEADGVQGQVYFDGGITGLNNPAAYAAAFARPRLLSGQSLQVISFGSGKSRITQSARNVEGWFFKQAVQHTVHALFSSTADLMDQCIREFGPELGITAYLRVDFDRDPGELLDSTDKLSRMRDRFKNHEVHYRLHGADSQTQPAILWSGNLPETLSKLKIEPVNLSPRKVATISAVSEKTSL